jgi:hypothetical protein
VVALRTDRGKLVTYSNWPEKSIVPVAEGRESELYDYRSHSGRLELHNSAGQGGILEEQLLTQFEEAFRNELRKPLPPRLVSSHARGFADYFATARHAAEEAIQRRRRRREQELEELEKLAREPEGALESSGGQEANSASSAEGERR